MKDAAMNCVTTRLGGMGPKKGGSLTVLAMTETPKLCVAVSLLAFLALTVTVPRPVKLGDALRRRTASWELVMMVALLMMTGVMGMEPATGVSMTLVITSKPRVT